MCYALNRGLLLSFSVFVSHLSAAPCFQAPGGFSYPKSSVILFSYVDVAGWHILSLDLIFKVWDQIWTNAKNTWNELQIFDLSLMMREQSSEVCFTTRSFCSIDHIHGGTRLPVPWPQQGPQQLSKGHEEADGWLPEEEERGAASLPSGESPHFIHWEEIIFTVNSFSFFPQTLSKIAETRDSHTHHIPASL